jgi:hypothetical protein
VKKRREKSDEKSGPAVEAIKTANAARRRTRHKIGGYSITKAETYRHLADALP